jgi:hypothetical protein
MNYEYYIDIGMSIMHKDKLSNRSHLMELGFAAQFAGLKVAACNVVHKGSDFFESIKGKGFDLFMPFYYDGFKYIVSIYPGDFDDVDCSELAGLYGGGGHKGAAGFESTIPPFMDCKPLRDII